MSWCCSFCRSMLCSFKLLQTSLKWLIFLHAAHISPYAGHHLDRWMEPHYLHLYLMGVLVCFCSCISFLPFYSVSCKYFVKAFCFIYIFYEDWLCLLCPNSSYPCQDLFICHVINFFYFCEFFLLFLYLCHCHSAHV